MSKTIVESSPVFKYKLKNCLNSHKIFNREVTEGSYPSTDPGDYNPCSAKQNVAISTCLLAGLRQQGSSCAGKAKVGLQEKFLNLVLKLREPVAEYQEKQGLPRESQCSFSMLITLLVQRSYYAVLTIVMMLYNLFPVVEGFVFLLRFILDKVIEICYTSGKMEMVLKVLLFLGELSIIFIIVRTIFGLILMPTYSLLSYVPYKFFGINLPGSE